MAETPSNETAPEAGSGGASKLPLIIVLLNTVAILAALGTFVYTRIIFKRPAITEQAERERLASEQANKPTAPTDPGLIHFDPVTINIKPTSANPKAEATPGPGQFPGQMHYAQIAFSFEVNDISKKDAIESLRPIILDRVLSMVGRKSFEELATVQGRYLLRTQMMDAVNELLKIQSISGDAAVTNVYFTQFQVQ